MMDVSHQTKAICECKRSCKKFIFNQDNWSRQIPLIQVGHPPALPLSFHFKWKLYGGGHTDGIAHLHIVFHPVLLSTLPSSTEAWGIMADRSSHRGGWWKCRLLDGRYVIHFVTRCCLPMLLLQVCFVPFSVLCHILS